MATYAIGDVQGCYDALMRLLDSIQFDEAKDQLWFVGDLVNRGPASLAVLRFLKKLGAQHVMVLGNHDLHFLAVARGYQALRPLDTFQDLLSAPDCDELVEWLRNRPLLHFDAKLNFIVLHAGLYPKWTLEQAQRFSREVEVILRGDQFDEFLKVMYGNEPDCWTETLQGYDRARFIINAMTRMRYCDKEARLNLTEKGVLGEQPSTLFPWYKIPRAKPLTANIVFGHWAALNGQTDTANVFATDTGCAWGYTLSALRLEDKRFFQTPCEEPF